MFEKKVRDLKDTIEYDRTEDVLRSIVNYDRGVFDVVVNRANFVLKNKEFGKTVYNENPSFKKFIDSEVGSYGEFIDKLCELVDMLDAYKDAIEFVILQTKKGSFDNFISCLKDGAFYDDETKFSTPDFLEWRYPDSKKNIEK